MRTTIRLQLDLLSIVGVSGNADRCKNSFLYIQILLGGVAANDFGWRFPCLTLCIANRVVELNMRLATQLWQAERHGTSYV